MNTYYSIGYRLVMRNYQNMYLASATEILEILGSFMIWFSWLFWSWMVHYLTGLYAISFVLMCFQRSLIHVLQKNSSTEFFLFMDSSMDWDSHFVFTRDDPRSKIYVEVYDGIVSILIFETRCSSSDAFQIQWWVWQWYSSSEISSEDQVY